jgi:phospholipase/carboxylesterase
MSKPLETRQMGALRCHLYDQLPTGQQPDLGIVLCHGYGAPGTDLTQLGPALLQAEPALRPRVQFLFPEAPLSLAEFGMPGGRAWWQFSVQRLLSQLQTGRFDEVREVVPEGLAEARDALMASIDEWRVGAGLAWSQVVLGGFSQGAMITVETAAALSETPAGMILLSGTLIHESAWRQGLSRKPQLPAFQSHGRHDTILPYMGAEWLKGMLEESGVALTFLPFAGGHEISWEVLEGVGEFLKPFLTAAPA